MSQSHNPTPADPRFEFGALKSLYEIYRDYMKHEDDLLNHRSTWHQVIQGFLFATLGGLGQWRTASDLTPNLGAVSRYLIEVVSVVGVLVALASLFSCLAANFAIDKLDRKWKDEIRNQFDPSIWSKLPGLAGAGSSAIKNWGKTPALAIPLIVLVAWTCIFSVSLAHRNDVSRPCISTALAKPAPPLSVCAEVAGEPAVLNREELIAALGCSAVRVDDLRQELRARYGLSFNLANVRPSMHR